MAAAVAQAAALLSFNPDDPNFNNAVAHEPTNWLAEPGAYFADIMLSTLGLAAILAPLAILLWGWRMLLHRAQPRWWLNATLLPLAMLAFAGFLAIAPAPPGWPLKTGLGGVLGDLTLHRQVLVALEAAGLGVAPWIGAVGLLVVGFGLFIFCLGLSRTEWRQLMLGLGAAGVAAKTGLANGGTLLGGAMLGAGGRREPVLSEDNDEPAGPYLSATRTKPAKRVERKRVDPPAAKRQRAAQTAMRLGRPGEFQLPLLSMLNPVPRSRAEGIDEEALEQNARLLQTVLAEFGVVGDIVKVRPGPVVSLYELEPAPGTKTSRVIGLSDDIARSMSALSARVAVIPGRNAIGIELPNLRRETVYLAELLASRDFESAAAKLPLTLGKDIAGAAVIADLARMPHLLVAGTTGSGKSVAINTMILSLLYRLTPAECRLILIDPKMLELSVYDGIPHLLAPVVTDPGKAIVALKWTVREMEERYRKMSELGVRNIASFNQRLKEARARGERLTRSVQTGFDPDTGQPIFETQDLSLDALPLIVVVVDELADLMMVAGKDIEAAMQRLAQMARAAGIHLIVATQRPSVDVITGTIKANFPTRISFQVTSKIDSRTILNEQGAEQLLGMGDMLFMPSAGRVTRVHGPFVSDEEVETVVGHLKSQGGPEFDEAVTAEIETDAGLPGSGAEGDALYDQAVALICRERKASTSFIQRHLQIGYNRAARIMDKMEAEGVVGAANHVGKREVLV
jgi:S-DNA-T family DNA segregation ATPase FtsK/SpoIIIE